MRPLDHPAIAILGPTASGKSRLAMSLALRFRGEIVSCDALQVYRFMEIGTAKPGTAERAAISHHMLDLRLPGEDFSAGDYQRLARDVLNNIRDRGKIPVVAGGTGFYLRALVDGLFEGPARSEELRVRMRSILRRKGGGRLYRALLRVDPKAAHRISPADSSRIIRAYEVYLVSGRSMSWWQEQPTGRLEGFRWLKLALAWPREILYRRIDRRVEEMFDAGFVDEVAGLLKQYPRESHAFKAIGYRQISNYLDGTYSLDQTVEETRRESRRYAKRQMTWFRSLTDVVWLDAAGNWPDVENEANRLVERFLKGGTDN